MKKSERNLIIGGVIGFIASMIYDKYFHDCGCKAGSTELPSGVDPTQEPFEVTLAQSDNLIN